MDLWLHRVFDTAEDFRLRGALPALLGALRKLQPESWEACVHVNTSPVSRVVGGMEDAILDKGLGPIGAHQLQRICSVQFFLCSACANKHCQTLKGADAQWDVQPPPNAGILGACTHIAAM